MSRVTPDGLAFIRAKQKTQRAPRGTIVLPLPHKHLSPNARVHWAAKSKQVKTYRDLARVMAERNLTIGLKRAFVKCRFFFKDRRRRDKDNLLSSMKAAFDGLADAGVVANDSELTYLPVEIEVDISCPRVEVTVLVSA